MELSELTTEQQNPATARIDQMDTPTILKLINEEDKKAALAVESVLPEITKAVDLITDKISEGGRLFYIGAGTSGRLGVLDASECPATFGVSPHLVQGIIAGGIRALVNSLEGAEDNRARAISDLNERNFSASDVLTGIAASGRTPYVLSGLEYAKSLGASTIAISCVDQSEASAIADIAITPITGAEVITGSTRMKAGTATKMILNMLTTATMIRLGKVYGNLMVDLHATNDKLRDRARRIIMTATGCGSEEALAALEKADGHAKTAIELIKKAK